MNTPSPEQPKLSRHNRARTGGRIGRLLTERRARREAKWSAEADDKFKSDLNYTDEVAQKSSPITKQALRIAATCAEIKKADSVHTNTTGVVFSSRKNRHTGELISNNWTTIVESRTASDKSIASVVIDDHLPNLELQGEVVPVYRLILETVHSLEDGGTITRLDINSQVRSETHDLGAFEDDKKWGETFSIEVDASGGMQFGRTNNKKSGLNDVSYTDHNVPEFLQAVNGQLQATLTNRTEFNDILPPEGLA